MANETGRESDKFMLRLPDGMRERIKSIAEENGRSMNAEIVGALAAAFPNSRVASDMLADLYGIIQHNSSKIGQEDMAVVYEIFEDLFEEVRRLQRVDSTVNPPKP